MPEDERQQFMAAINFAVDQAGPDAVLFLRLWRDGCWPEIQSEFPEFDGPFPGLCQNK